MNQENSQSKRLFTGLAVGAIFGLGVGLLVGLAFAYLIAPVEWTDAGPQDLREDYAACYWRLVAESYDRHGNLDLAKKQLGEWDAEKRIEQALTRARIESSPEEQMVLDSLAAKIVGPETAAAATTAPAAATPAPEGREGTSILPILGVLLLIVLIFVVIALIVVRTRKRRAAAEPGMAAVEDTPEWLATMRTEETEMAAPSLGHFVTSYALGNDTYDESFSIETATGEFLGECGVGISETIGTGAPDKVTAFEVWLFDKNDIRTVTKVVMSEHAFHDPDLRASLVSKGEAVLAQVNEPVILETATLRVQATLTEVIYGQGALPPNSYFDRLTVELVTYQKEEQVGELPVEKEDHDLDY